MKKYTKLLSILFTLSFILLFFLPSVKGFDDIEYNFEKNDFYTNSEINSFNKTFNLKNQSYYDDIGNYPALYTFINETDGTNSTDIGFVDVDNSGANTLVSVISEIANHKKVLSLYDNSNPNAVGIENNISNEAFGTIEFWLRTTDATKTSLILIQEQYALFGMRILSDKFELFKGGGWADLGLSASDNLWYHISMDFDSTNGGYEGLAQYDFRIRVNTEVFGDFDYANELPFIDSILIGTGGVDSGYTTHIDAIGYSWGRLTTPFWINCTQIDAYVGSYYVSGNLDDDSYYNDSNVITYSSSGTSPRIIDLYFFFDNTTTMRNLYFYWYMETQYIENFLNLWVSGAEIQDDFSYISGNAILQGGLIHTVRMVSSEHFQGFFLYIDLIRFAEQTFFEYIVGSNMFPLIIETDYLEVDKYEFGLESINSLYSLGHHTTVNNWNLYEFYDGTTEIIADPLDANDRMIEMSVLGYDDQSLLTYIDINTTGQFLRVSFDFKLITGTTDSIIYFHVVSYPLGGDMVKLKMDFTDMSLSYDNGAGYTELRDDIQIDTFYVFDLFLNLEMNICSFDYYINGSLDESFTPFPLVVQTGSGIFSVAIIFNSEGGTAVIHVDGIGIYMDLRSLNIHEYSWCYIDLGNEWLLARDYLLKYNSNGTYHFSIVDRPLYLIDDPLYTIKGLSVYNDSETLKNVANMDYNFFETPLLLFYIKGQNFKIDLVSIEGVSLFEGINTYLIEFEFSGVNENISYFYVNNGKLHYTYEASQDGVLEFIQASFNINDEFSNDTVIQFTAQKSVGAFGFFRVVFEETSRVIQIDTGVRTKRIILPRSKTIKEFIILISDTNKDTITGLTTGYITNIKLLDVEEAFVSIISLNLISMIIPLIIIILPTVLISKLYGDFLVIPLFIMFSLILTISNMIPIWLFFIILLSSSLFIFFEKDKKVRF